MNRNQKTILLVGPETITSSAAYGGGTGGYTRNMSVYLATLTSEDFAIEPFYHSVNGQYRGIRAWRATRMIADSARFAAACLRKRPVAVHILAQYRKAVFREFGQAVICRMLGTKIVYDVKAGAFGAAIDAGGFMYRAVLKYIIGSADMLFAEGNSTANEIRTRYGREAIYFPNYVPKTEVPHKIDTKLCKEQLRLLFVGFCNKSKGAVELVEGALQAARGGVRIRLELIGAESADFESWVNSMPACDELTIQRQGKQPHDVVLAAMKAADVYVYPTRHEGEGHNNSINEAMMNGLVILTTRQGFLPDVLSGECAIFLDNVSAQAVGAAILRVHQARGTARALGVNAREKLIRMFTDDNAKQVFTSSYKALLGIAE